jgi:hypothetical protein
MGENSQSPLTSWATWINTSWRALTQTTTLACSWPYPRCLRVPGWLPSSSWGCWAWLWGRYSQACLKATDPLSTVDCPEAAFSQGLAVLMIPPPCCENLGPENEIKGGGEEGQRGRKGVNKPARSPSAAVLHTPLSVTPPAPRSLVFR